MKRKTTTIKPQTREPDINIATGETSPDSPVIAPFNFYGYSNFSNFYQ